ncbi:ribonuclease R family protein [Frigoriglobus tundricola]|uniref:Ribonuclease R n=1 Tax=Frigoriglobus tundricola TaxID=2774151 RepID=A0A6M5YVG0_9BACT|nr:RNB domain-containing ribonuclease [Frigoriglobus tundricola]QJW97464.1 3'-to-5' exoribonuclease RNase R [Frigoriglobus tundricola]
MPDLLAKILHAVTAKSYVPLKAKPLFKRLNLGADAYPEFRRTVRELIRTGRLTMGRNNTLRAGDAHGSVTGVYRRAASGHGFVRPHTVGGVFKPEIFIREDKALDAATGDEVMVRVTREATHIKDAAGEIVRVLERATRTFVGTYFERDREGLVRIDGNAFTHSVIVGDASAKGAKPQDKVVIEMLRFPTPDERGEGVVTEVLGPHGKPGVDTLSVIRAFGLPEAFPEAALAEARQVASQFSESDLSDREDFTNDLVVTIDPPDAKDYDDAVSVAIDPKTKHWVLTVHIADVAAFVKPGGALDTEARKRATSVYLPQKVIPMFPEVISNGLASLQEGKVRYVKTVQMEFTPGLQKGHVRFANGAIRNRKRFTYDEVQALLEALNAEPGTRNESPADDAGSSVPRSAVRVPGSEDDLLPMLRRMRDLALLLRKKRFKRGSLQLEMPEAVLEYDADGRVSGAHFAEHNLSHQIVEEFMLAANEAVAEHFTRYEVPFLRRVHPAPNEEKLEAFAQFADLLGHPMKRAQDRFELQRVLDATADKPERAAVHFALLRSLKQATYSPIQDEHYALASQHYCHFTSPIRRYPDLQVHRLLDKWVRTGSASANVEELAALGEHCSKMERRAETAERELVKTRILAYLSGRLGERLDAVITGVADYGFFAQAERFPAEGLVHISSLVDDYYWFDESAHTLEGRRTRRRFRLGDRVRVEVARVDLQRRMLDLRLADPKGKPEDGGSGAPLNPAPSSKREGGAGEPAGGFPHPKRGKRRK